MSCTKEHSITDQKVKNLPIGQEGTGRHKCASCAYEIGYNLGLERNENFNLESILDGLVDSQRGPRRHRSPHAAFSLGYYNGVIDSY